MLKNCQIHEPTHIKIDNKPTRTSLCPTTEKNKNYAFRYKGIMPHMEKWHKDLETYMSMTTKNTSADNHTTIFNLEHMAYPSTTNASVQISLSNKTSELNMRVAYL